MGTVVRRCPYFLRQMLQERQQGRITGTVFDSCAINSFAFRFLGSLEWAVPACEKGCYGSGMAVAGAETAVAVKKS